MTRSLRIRRALGTLLALFLPACLAAAEEALVVRGETVYPVSGPPIVDGLVLIRDGEIVAVGSEGEVTIPDGAHVLEAQVVTPGLVDARSTAGFSGIFNVPHDQDQLERSSPLQPELRAIDAYNAREELVDWVRGFGVTTLHAGHAPGALISGQTLIAKTVGETVDEAVIVPAAMVAMSLGPGVSRNFDSPGTRAKGVAMLRARLIEAREYAAKLAGDEPPSRNLGLEVLAEVLAGERRALVTAYQAGEIVAALRLAREFGFDLVLDGAAEAYLVLDEIRRAGVPVILHPTMARHFGETRNVSFETAARLREAAIPFAIQSGFEGYVPKTRVVLFEAAIAAAHGLGFEGALAAVTLDAARILGIADRVGSLEPGKDADLVLFDGDPFEYRSRVCGVVIDGRVVEDTCR